MRKEICRILSLIFVVTTTVLAQGSFAVAQSKDVYKDLYNAVDKTHLATFLKDMTGGNPVTVDGRTFSVTERYSSQGKANFRSYWTSVFKALGMPVTELPYKTKHIKVEPTGHNLEAVLKGQSADSVVIIIHYDSIGPKGHETNNPGVDDDMTGMAMMLETARLFAGVKSNLLYTVRFVAADFEEWASPGLEGARAYSSYLKQLSQQQNFKVVASIDYEQSGWSGSSNSIVDLFSCTHSFSLPNSNALGDLFADTVSKYSGLAVTRGCMGANSDFYAMLEIGVPSVVFSEHNPFNNPHFDSEGDDTFEKIDLDYFYRISQVGITFAGRVVGLVPTAQTIPVALR